MSKLLALASLAVALLLSAAPASAQDWVSSILAEQRRQAGNSESRPTRAAQRSLSNDESSTRSTRRTTSASFIATSSRRTC